MGITSDGFDEFHSGLDQQLDIWRYEVAGSSHWMWLDRRGFDEFGFKLEATAHDCR